MFNIEHCSVIGPQNTAGVFQAYHRPAVDLLCRPANSACLWVCDDFATRVVMFLGRCMVIHTAAARDASEPGDKHQLLW